MYCLELGGESDAFAAREAAAAASDVAVVAPGIATARGIVDSRVRRLAYTHAACDLLARTDADVEAARLALEAASLDRTGTVAVRARNVRRSTDVSTREAERALGRVLVDRGFEVDLDDPDHELRALFSSGIVDGESRAVCLLGWLAVESVRDFGDRTPTDRPFFQPGSMAPIDARAYVNIAGAAPGRTVLDPMCGTGGILLEAALVGARPIGVDAQRKMVRGTRQNLEAYLEAPFDVLRGDATDLPFRDRSI
ncbi:MAG: methyltransferase domain-containing protein, partial [Halobacteriota archaeon]